MNPTLNAALAFVVVIVVARFFGLLAKKMGQPSVMGEVVGGILLGPSLFGAFFPELSAELFSTTSLSLLKFTANLGIVLYLFIMGLELNLPRLRRSAGSAILISQTSIIIPFTLGCLLAGFLYTHYAPPETSRLGFFLFIGVSLSITAFPVLARILEESKYHRSPLGDLALSCAAIDDITAWCLVAILTGLMTAGGNPWWVPILLTPLYVSLLFLGLRPFIRRLTLQVHNSSPWLSRALLGLAILGAIFSAAISEWLGLHAFIGAFLFGVIIPHNSAPAKEAYGGLQKYVGVLLLPSFFALTGLKTEIALISSLKEVWVCAIIIAVAILGKMGGTYLGAKLSKRSNRESLILGVLMNTRGLVELIVLNIGLTIGLLTPTLFTMFVFMALVTTFMTGPLLKTLSKNHLS